MNAHSETSIPGQESITALRERLADIEGIADRHLGHDALSEKLLQHLPPLHNLLSNLERELTDQALEQDELAALYDVSQAIGSSLDLTEVLNEVMDQIIRLTGAERAFLMLEDPETDVLQCPAARNVDRETIDSSSFEISRGIIDQVAASGDPIITTNAQMDPRFKTHESVIGYDLRSILCVPLKVRGRVTGVIYADNRIRTGLFSKRDLDLLTAFASQAAGVIENARLFERVTEAKRLMDNIFASIPSGVITTDRNGQITLFNQAAEQILQTPSMLVEGLQLSEAFPQLAEDLQPAIEEVEKHKRDVTEFESELSLSEQGQINLRASLSPLENDDDEMEGLAIVLDDITEQRRLEARDKLFQRYLPPTVIERLPNDPQELRLGGQRQEITILFADIRGFTDFSHQHSPETLVDVLNQYLSIGAEAVLSEEGTLDKMMGDCVIAFFNAPLPQSDHTLRAIRAALKIHEGVSRLHKQVPKSRRLSFGIGISVGDAVVGNVGTAKQMNYTAIGSIVNLANRLEASASPGEILLSRTAYQRVKNQVEAQPVSPQKVETLGQSIKAYKLLKLR